MAYIYKNEVGRAVNIGGYQFAVGQELSSDIKISGFNEAVSNGFLSLKEGDVKSGGDAVLHKKPEKATEMEKPAKPEKPPVEKTSPAEEKPLEDTKL